MRLSYLGQLRRPRGALAPLGLSYVGQLRRPRGALAPLGLSYVGRRCRSRNEPAPLRGFPGSNLVHLQMKKAPARGPFIHLVAGA
jgi:hypothetical protein